MDPDLDAGLFGIHLSDSEDGANGSEPKRDAVEAQADRTAQSEEEFQAVRKEYVVKVENGEIWKSITLPLDTGRVSKPDAQALLHAVEELYFFRRFAEGAQFVKSVFDGAQDGNGVPGLDNDTRKLLQYYEKKCNEKVKSR